MKKTKLILALVGATLLSANALAKEPDYDANGFATDESNPNQYQEPTKIDGVYQIANAGNLYWFADFVNQGGDNAKANAVLTKDIVVNENVLGTNNANVNASGAYTGDDSNFEKWAPINGFAGKFHGQGHTISGLYFNDPKKEKVGLFGSVGNVEIDGLGLVDSYFEGSSNVGGFVGYAGGTVYIRNSYNSSVVRGHSGNDWWCGVGGFVGAAEVNKLEIENSYNLGFVTGGPAVGGLVGIIKVDENFSVSNSYNAGDVKGTAEDVGGLVGFVGLGYLVSDDVDAGIVSSYNTGSVCGAKEGVGGLVGYLEDWFEIRIVNSYNTGTVDGDDAGGLTGADGEGFAYVYNSYNAGLVNSGNGDALGLSYDVDNFYYLEGSSVGFYTSKSAADFADGTVAQALRDYDKDKEEGEKIGSDVWGQYVGIDETPTLRGSIKFGPTQITEGDYAGFYALADADDLYWFANHVNQGGDNVNANAILTDDIVVNTLEFKDGEIVTDGKNYRVWTPIGISYDNSYKGTFDGNGKTISKLYFDNSDQDYVGLFGYNEGTIKNVGVVGSYFNGGFYVGGVCGYNNAGTITNCYNTGVVSGSLHIGGVCGYNYEYNSTIENCYNTGEVSGLQNIGGVSGYNNYGDITNCYTTGKVSGEDKVGGVCGWYDYGDITNCYYLSDADNGNNAKTIEQFNNGCVAYLLSQGDNGGVWGQDLSKDNSLPMLNGSKVYKNICEDVLLGYSNEDKSYEKHEYENGICKHCGLYYPAVINTDGYYEIANAGNLYWFAQYVNQCVENLNANAILVNNIEVNTEVLVDGKLNSNETFREWTPIGISYDNSYKGTFDGNGKTISGLYFDNSEQDCVGLFGNNEGTIKNVGVVESYFKGNQVVGGVCGLNEGTITNCYNTGEVSGSDGVGGVCGYNSHGTITNCYNTGEVSGGNSVGGVCGYNFNIESTITNCYYLETSANTGIGEGDGEATAKTATQFADGTVAKLLFASDTIWGQNTSTDTVPNFSGKILFKVTLTAENGTAENGLGEYNKKYEIKATANTGYHFAGWSNGSTEIKDSILVVNDTALVATFEAHSFGNWDTTLVATCAVAGLRTRACACGEVETDTIAKLAHTVVVDSAKTATCTVAGLTEGKHCSVCGSVLVVQQTVAKIAHTVVVDSAKTATCTATGLTEGKHCSVCDSVLLAQQTVAKIAHTVVVDSAKTATCTVAGLTEGKHCSVCDSILVAQQTLPALGHKLVIVAGVSATCTATGLTEGSHCSVCGEVIKAQETIPALGHLFTNYIYNNDATTEADGTETAVCDHGCGATDTRTAEGTKLTDIDATETAEVAIYAHHNVIVVENAETDIYVYDVTGRCIEMRESCPSVEIAMQREGIYIVRTGGKTQRVFVAQN